MTLRLLAFLALAMVAAIPAARADWSPFGAYWDNIARAAGANNASAVQNLLNDGKSPNQSDDQSRTGLHFAAMDDNLQIAAILIRAGADLNAQDRFGNTPLHLAAERDRTDVAKLLIEAGARVDPQNKDGLTPLMMAARAGRPELVRLLLSAGADPTKSDYTGRDAAGWAEDGHSAAVRQVLQRAIAAH